MDKENKKITLAIGLVTLLIIIISAVVFIPKKENEKPHKETEEIIENIPKNDYKINNNGLEKFDLYFLKQENENVNKVYSPLSIKYALEMLAEGASGETKAEILSVLGSYKATKYTNTQNISLANALFVKDTYKKGINESYSNKINKKYGAELIVDPFANPNNINNWVNEKTLNLIPNITNNLNDVDYMLVNALAIDMEWEKLIHAIIDQYENNYLHEKSGPVVYPLALNGSYEGSKIKGVSVEFNDKEAEGLQFAGSVNKYDIVKELGRDKIYEEIKKEYQEWIKDESNILEESDRDVDKFVNNFIDELNKNYKHYSLSTDFRFNVTDNEKVFAKTLKEYNGTRLEYVAIMPKKENLNSYIKNVEANHINDLIKGLKGDKYEDYKEGYVTNITGYLPTFKFDYKLNLKQDLINLGIKNVFDKDKSELKNMTDDKAYISKVEHKSNIEFSNEGIKAAASTTLLGGGATSGGFEHIYDVPEIKIDLNFDKPYMFLIRDTKTGEIWFTGTVYEPNPYTIEKVPVEE